MVIERKQDKDSIIRYFGQNSLIYPHFSRRLKGLSIGINSSPSKTCNFGCLYCAVNRSEQLGNKQPFSTETIRTQLENVLINLQKDDMFKGKEIKAITFAGDGEPTILRDFDKLIRTVIDVKNKFNLTDTKIVVSSNASGLHRSSVRKGLDMMYANNGELWAKLDAGTERYFRQIANTNVRFDRILSNILDISLIHPIKVQTCFMTADGMMPEDKELDAYCERVNNILNASGQITSIVLYNITLNARPARKVNIQPLTKEQMDYVYQRLKSKISIPIEVYI